MKKILSLILGIFLLSGCSAFTKPEELRVGILSWSGYEPLALASSLGYYPQEEIKIIRFPSVIDVMGAMRNGTIDVASLTIDESLAYAQDNPDLRAFLVCDISNGGDGVVAKAGITSVKQLKGKRIGAEESVLSSFVLNRFLESSGLALSDITLVPINYDLQFQAFSSDQADALVTYNPVKDKLIEQGGNLLFDSTKMPDEIVDVLIARDAVLKVKKESVSILINGWFKSLEYMKNNPHEANKRMASFENVSEKMFEHSLKGIIIPSREESIELLNKYPNTFFRSPTGLAHAMKKQGLLKKDASFEYFFTSEYVSDK